MAIQICPKCRNESFLWSMYDDLDIITQWYCHKCNYMAFEDERDERVCSVCENKTESFLKDENLGYWWCFTCKVKRPS